MKNGVIEEASKLQNDVFCEEMYVQYTAQDSALLSLVFPLCNMSTALFPAKHSSEAWYTPDLVSGKKKGKWKPKSHLSTQQLSHVPLCNSYSSKLALVLTSRLCNQGKQPHSINLNLFLHMHFMLLKKNAVQKKKKANKWTVVFLKNKIVVPLLFFLSRNMNWSMHPIARWGCLLEGAVLVPPVMQSGRIYRRKRNLV